MKTPENTSAIEFEMEEKLKLIKKEIINEDDVGGAYLITLRALVTFLPARLHLIHTPHASYRATHPLLPSDASQHTYRPTNNIW